MNRLSKEQQEFVQLVTNHQGVLRGLCRILMPGRESEIEDVLQDVNRVILEKSGEFQLGSDFKAWAFAIVRFQVMAFQSGQKRNRLLFSSDLMEGLSEEVQQFGAFDLRMKWLTACLKELKTSERELVEVRYRSQSTLNEYSVQCGRTVAGLKRALARIREKLKWCIGQKMLQEEAI